ncbi:MAG: membrane dipeptidase [Erysipelotrichales bacterium]
MKDFVVDLHGDLFSHFKKDGLDGGTNTFKTYHLDNFKEGNVGLSLFNIWIEDFENAKNEFKDIIRYGSKEIVNNRDVLNQVNKYDDIVDNKINYIIGAEGLDFMEEVEDIYSLYQYGVRLVSLTWNNTNKYCSSITNDVDCGLSDKGRQVIEIMKILNMIIDISHLSNKAALEILEDSSYPIIASHSNVRNLASHKRNLSDELIKKVAATNGVIGMNSFPLFISDNEEKKNVQGLVEHINYIKDLVGIEYVAFGFDFMDYLDDEATSFIEGSSYTDDLKNHSMINNLIVELEKQGYTNEEIQMIKQDNALRVIKDIIK